MPDIIHRIGVNTPPEDVYRALASIDGLRGWWTEFVSGVVKEGGILSFRFPNGGPDMKILKLKTNRYVQWECVANIEEWLDTIITFDIFPDSENKGSTIIHFSHRGWRQETPMMGHCSLKWGVFLLSLKSYCESGEGQPFPHDIQIEGKE